MIELSNENFDELISKDRVLVDFYATWCGPCKMMHPVLEELDKEIDIKIVKVNVDNFNELSRKYGIMSIPTLLYFNTGELVFKKVGYTPKEELLKMLEN